MTNISATSFSLQKNSLFYGHFSLMVQHLPLLATLVCEGCIKSHQKIIISLPEIEPEFVETSLLEFYFKGEFGKLKDIIMTVITLIRKV